MTKKLLAKVGTYTNRNNEQKNEYVTLGILKPGSNGGEFLLLDPSVNLAGVLLKQQKFNVEQGKQPGDMVMVSVFDNHQNNQQNNQQNNKQPQQNQQQPGYQGGFQQQPNPANFQQGQQQNNQFDDDINF